MELLEECPGGAAREAGETPAEVAVEIRLVINLASQYLWCWRCSLTLGLVFFRVLENQKAITYRYQLRRACWQSQD